jgi:hypothetical protein
MVTRETRCWLDLDNNVELPRATIIRRAVEVAAVRS